MGDAAAIALGRVRRRARRRGGAERRADSAAAAVSRALRDGARRTRAPRTSSRRRRAAASRWWWPTLAGMWLGVLLSSPAFQGGVAQLLALSFAVVAAGAGRRDRRHPRPRTGTAPAHTDRRGRHRDRGRCRRISASCRELPWPVERALLVLGGVWFVNLVNFMDGLDWMTVAEVVPVSGGRGAARRDRHGAAARRCWLRLALLGAIDRLCAVQPAGGAAVSRRCRQPADRAAAWLAAAAAGGARPSRGRAAAAALLSRRRDDDARTAASRAAKRSGRRIARTSISARPTAASRCRKSSCGCSCSTSRSPALALVSAIEPDPTVDLATLALGGALVAWVLLTFARGKR